MYTPPIVSSQATNQLSRMPRSTGNNSKKRTLGAAQDIDRNNARRRTAAGHGAYTRPLAEWNNMIQIGYTVRAGAMQAQAIKQRQKATNPCTSAVYSRIAAGVSTYTAAGLALSESGRKEKGA